ncbi:MAG: hypothetical protein FWB96_13150 [Defluviitaleaceae bacterium]|nr:hypothetical protein [Defluviitaleaceae bacterium]MCL2264177.1 hypothetical protein [Defluviitaleaceae bacterium]
MIEILLAYIILVDVGLVDIVEYENKLNELICKSHDDELLLELVWCFSDIQKAKGLIFNYCERYELNIDSFGEFLMKRLKMVYLQSDIDLHEFSSKVILAWGKLPERITQVEPFWSMSYAGEPLSWGDVQQTRKLFEEMFDFYESKR